jgi:hypothetical protein
MPPLMVVVGLVGEFIITLNISDADFITIIIIDVRIDCR